jgi:ArsR family transcriptional regulator
MEETASVKPRTAPDRPMARTLAPETLELVAQRFRALGEPMRLRLLGSLRAGERTVSDLVLEHRTSQANISKHLALLASVGLLRRRKEGLNVFYAIADPSVFGLCDVVCGSLKKHAEARARALR